MNIISIENKIRSTCFNETMINQTLKNGMFGDDYVNDNAFLFFKVQLENRKDYISFLYRRLYECIYMKSSQYSYILDNDNGVAILKISLSESIRLLQSSLIPPLMKQTKMNEYVQSIDHITCVLNDVFFDKLTRDRNMGKFQELIMFCPFPYESNYNMNRTNKLIEICGIYDVCDVITSNTNVSSIINWSAGDVISFVCVVTTRDIQTLCSNLDNSINVTSLKVNPDKSVSVKCVVNEFNGNPYLLSMIKNTYEKLNK